MRPVLSQLLEKKPKTLPSPIGCADDAHDLDLPQRLQRLEMAVDGAQLGVWDWDLRSGVTTHNEHWAQMIGYTLDEVARLPTLWEDALHPEDREPVLDKLSMLLSGDIEFYEVEHRLRAKNDDWVWILSRANVVESNQDGIPLRVAGTHLDVTDRKRIENVLADERQLLRSLIDNIPDLIYAKDLEGRFIVKNIAGARPLGARNPDHVIGRTDFDFYPIEQASDFRASELAMLNGEQPVINREEVFDHDDGSRCWLSTTKVPFQQPVINREEVFDHDDGSRCWLSTTKVPFRDQRGDVIGLVGIGRDITSQKELEHTLRFGEQRFKDFALLGADILWELDADLRYTFVSESFAAITGVSARSRLGSERGKFVAQYAGQESDILTLWRRHLDDLHARRPFKDFDLTFSHPNGELRYVRTSGRPVYDESGRFLGYRGVDLDTTESRQLAKQLRYQASHDSLTGLANRRCFETKLAAALADLGRDGGRFVLGYLDLDQFKIVNDTAGHQAGDRLLRHVAEMFSTDVRDQDLLARLGGDEFGLILADCGIDEAQAITTRMAARLANFTFVCDDRAFKISASIGLVAAGDGAASATAALADLMTWADIACYTAKDLGRNRVHVYSPQDAQLRRRLEELQQAAGLREAITDQRLRLFCQPIVKLDGRGLAAAEQSIYHHEVLVRMRSEDGSMLPPAAFIPAAERYGLITAIDRWVVTQCIDRAAGSAAAPSSEPRWLSVNLSGASLCDRALADFIIARLRERAVAPGRLCFEITETALISNIEQARSFIRLLKDQGCSIALDDFGSGLSSFNYLKQFPIDYLKIDGSFVRDLAHNETDRAMVEAIHQLGRTLGIKTIAEFVEDQNTVDRLIDIGVDYAQGYVFGAPRAFSHTRMTASKACSDPCPDTERPPVRRSR